MSLVPVKRMAMDKHNLPGDSLESLVNPIHKLILDYQEMMAAAYCKETHLLPSEVVMRIQFSPGEQIVWFEPKSKNP